ncbi:MAG: benzoate/H(+) symporter BenE family transporter [Brachymonas denitrificans]
MRSTLSGAPDAHAHGPMSAILAGLLAVAVSYAGPLLIFFQAAHAGNMSPEMTTSWVWAISVGAGVSGIFLSWFLKVPVVTAWSAPGTALLITLFPAITMPEVVGAYITAAVLIFLVGVSGYFDKLVRMIPRGVAAGMMAGILFQFGLNVFQATASMPEIALSMIVVYLLARRFFARYAVLLVLLAGVLLSWSLGQTQFQSVTLELAMPVFTLPQWTWQSTLSFALPLVLVSLTGQFLPGMAILQLSGYHTPARPIIMVTSLTSLAVAAFGGITTVLAAITAALCTGKDAHEDPGKRYIAGIANGVFYLVGALFAGSIVTLFAALPPAFVAALAGLALIGAITSNVVAAMEQPEHRESAIVCFLATASGMTFLGLGSAFWGIVIGSLAHAILSWRKRSQAAPAVAPAVRSTTTSTGGGAPR